MSDVCMSDVCLSAETDPSGGVLVPVDFSPSATAALVWGAEAARAFALPLEVLHVVHDLEWTPGYYKSDKKSLQRLGEAAEEMMREFMEKTMALHPNLESLRSARRTLVEGLPVNRILEVAAQSESQFIVMGSHGRTGLSRLLLGSKAQEVVLRSPIPVTIVKTPKDTWPEGIG